MAANRHTCCFPRKMLKTGGSILTLLSENTPGHKHPMRSIGKKKNILIRKQLHMVDLSEEAKAVAEQGKEEGPEGGCQPPPCSFDPRAMLAAGQSLLWAVLICTGCGCLPGGLVAAGDYWGQGHPPFSLPGITCTDGQGKGWGRNSHSQAASVHKHRGYPQCISCSLSSWFAADSCNSLDTHHVPSDTTDRPAPSKMGIMQLVELEIAFAISLLHSWFFLYINIYICIFINPYPTHISGQWSKYSWTFPMHTGRLSHNSE